MEGVLGEGVWGGRGRGVVRPAAEKGGRGQVRSGQGTFGSEIHKLVVRDHDVLRKAVGAYAAAAAVEEAAFGDRDAADAVHCDHRIVALKRGIVGLGLDGPSPISPAKPPPIPTTPT